MNITTHISEMTYKLEVTTGKWITEAAGNIFHTVKDEFLYKNEIVMKFIREEDKRFVIAGKGMGKTLLLAYKRKILEEKYGSTSLFIPADNPYVGSMIKVRDITADVINYLEDFDHCKSVWLLAIELSALSQAGAPFTPITEAPGINSKNPKKFKLFIEEMLRNPLTFDYIFDRMLAFTVNEIRQFVSEYAIIVDKQFRIIDRSIYYFFDRVDQALGHSDDRIWIPIQTGLLEAAWEAKRSNTHVKIYLSIRQEAYAELLTYNRGSMQSEVSVIKYKNNELQDLINQLLLYYEKMNSFEEFLGITYFHNITTNTRERIFSFMNRYSLGRPRDFVIFCGHMTDCLEQNEKVKKSELSNRFKKSIIENSSESIINSLHSELRMLMHCLNTLERFDSFVELLNYNILTYDDLQKICKLFHAKVGDFDCCDNCKECRKNAHPFCDLYNMGLLGIIRTNQDESESLVQRFKSPYERMLVGLRGNSPFFLIHPALRHYIEHLHQGTGIRDKYELLPGILVGDGLVWKPIHSIVAQVDMLLLNVTNQKIRRLLMEYIRIYAKKKGIHSFPDITFNKLFDIIDKCSSISDNDAQLIMKICEMTNCVQDQLDLLKLAFEEKILTPKKAIIMEVSNEFYPSKPLSYTNSPKSVTSILEFKNSVVKILLEDDFLGTGFLYRFNDEEYVVTCCHIFDNCSNINTSKHVFVQFQSSSVTKFNADVFVYQNVMDSNRGATQDIAILKLKGGYPQDVTFLKSSNQPTFIAPSHAMAYGFSYNNLLGKEFKNLSSWNDISCGFKEVKSDDVSSAKEGISGSPIIDISNNYFLIGVIKGQISGNLVVIPFNLIDDVLRNQLDKKEINSNVKIH